MKDRKGDKARLLHILDAMKEIESYIKNISEDEFLQHSMMRFATIKQLEIIGEAANHLTDETKKLFADLELKKIVGLRNIFGKHQPRRKSSPWLVRLLHKSKTLSLPNAPAWSVTCRNQKATLIL